MEHDAFTHEIINAKDKTSTVARPFADNCRYTIELNLAWAGLRLVL
jgi:hypothetical protein